VTGPVRWPLVTVDVDGTLTRRHGWETISDRLGRRPLFDRANARYLSGEAGEDEHLGELLSIATGARRAEVEDALAATPRLAGISEGIAELHAAGRRVALLTHNPTYVVDWYVARFGFDDAEGTRSQPVVDGVIAPPGPTRAGKLDGLRALATRAGVTTDRVVHVGDGRVDAELFPRVGRGIALNATRAEVRRAADVVLQTDDFRDVVAAIDRLPPRS
jgi:HAD superfamily phosphoserine phosphatase-like hydrolase